MADQSLNFLANYATPVSGSAPTLANAVANAFSNTNVRAPQTMYNVRGQPIPEFDTAPLASAVAARPTANVVPTVDRATELAKQLQFNEYAKMLHEVGNAGRNISQSGTVVPKGNFSADDFTPPLSNKQIAFANAARDPAVVSKLPAQQREAYLRSESQSAFDRAQQENQIANEQFRRDANIQNQSTLDALSRMGSGEFAQVVRNIAGKDDSLFRNLMANKLEPGLPGTVTIEREGKSITLPRFSPQTGAAPTTVTVPASRENLIRYRMQPDMHGGLYQVPPNVPYDPRTVGLQQTLSEKENNESYQGRYDFPTMTVKDSARGIDLEPNAKGARKGPRKPQQWEIDAAAGDNPMGRGGKTFMDSPAYSQGYKGRETFDQLEARMFPTYDYRKTDPRMTNLQVPDQIRTPGAPFGFVEPQLAPTLRSALYGAQPTAVKADLYGPPRPPEPTPVAQNLKEQLTPKDIFPDKDPGEALISYLRNVSSGRGEPVRVLDAATGESKYYLTDKKRETPQITKEQAEAQQLQALRAMSNEIISNLPTGVPTSSLENYKTLVDTIKAARQTEADIARPLPAAPRYSLDQRGADAYAYEHGTMSKLYDIAIKNETNPTKKAELQKQKMEDLAKIDERFFKKGYAPVDPYRGMPDAESATPTYDNLTK